MKRLPTTLIAAILLCGISYGQEIPSNYEHLKCYEARIGEWVCEGPALEDVPGIIAKGDPFVARMTFKWILNKNAIESTLSIKVPKTGFEYRSKGIIGWDAEEETIISGGMDSFGGHGMNIIAYAPKTKTWTTTSKGVDGTGAKTSSTTVFTIKDRDTFEMQEFDRKNSFVQGDGPKYNYKRVKK